MRNRFDLWRAIWLRPSWWWVVVAPWALLGILQGVRDEIPSKTIQERLFLHKLLPEWPWYVWGLITAGLVLVVILESSYRYVRRLRQEHQSELLKARDRFDANVQSLAKPPESTATRIETTDNKYPDRYSCTANIQVANIGELPIRCHVTGILVGGTFQIANLGRAYDVKWQGHLNAEQEIGVGESAVLNVVAWGIPRPLGFLPFAWGRRRLVFLTAESHGIEGPWFAEYPKPSWGDVVAHLRLIVTSHYLGHSDQPTRHILEYAVGPPKAQKPPDIEFVLRES